VPLQLIRRMRKQKQNGSWVLVANLSHLTVRTMLGAIEMPVPKNHSCCLVSLWTKSNLEEKSVKERKRKRKNHKERAKLARPQLQGRAGKSLDKLLVGFDECCCVRMLLDVFPCVGAGVHCALPVKMHCISGVGFVCAERQEERSIRGQSEKLRVRSVKEIPDGEFT